MRARNAGHVLEAVEDRLHVVDLGQSLPDAELRLDPEPHQRDDQARSRGQHLVTPCARAVEHGARGVQRLFEASHVSELLGDEQLQFEPVLALVRQQGDRPRQELRPR